MTRRLSALALALALPLAACDEAITGPDGARAGETTVVLSAGSAGSASLAPSFSAALLSAAGAGPVSLSDVKAIEVTVTKVQVLRVDSLRADSVVTLDVTAGGKINLLALPTEAANGLQLARGTLPEGTYGNLRLVFSGATVTFKRDVTAGGGPRAKTYAKDVAHPLNIGDGDKTTIKVPTGNFTVAKDAGSTVAVAFDGSASVKKVIVTPNEVKMPPVLSASGKSKDRGRD